MLASPCRSPNSRWISRLCWWYSRATKSNLLKSVDCGKNLDTLKAGDRGFSRIFISSDNAEHIVTADTSIFKSTDGGQTWQVIDEGIEYGADGKLTDFDVAANNFDLIYAGVAGEQAGGLYKTTDGGGSWSAVVNTSDTLLTDQTSVSDISITDGSDTDTVFVGIDNERSVIHTRDGGATWKETPLTDRTGPIGILRATSHYIFASVTGEGLFTIWHQWDSNQLKMEERPIPDSVQAIADFKSFSCEDYMNTDQGLYHVVTCVFANDKDQQAEHWTTLNDSLPNRQPTDLEMGPDGDYLFTATKSNNSYKLFVREKPVIAALPDDAIPRTISLEPNYPNPFNPTTQIEFSLPQATKVELAVYNTLGQRVALLANRYMNAGTHNLQFDGSELSSGVYIYRLKTDGYSKSRKMLLMK